MPCNSYYLVILTRKPQGLIWLNFIWVIDLRDSASDTPVTLCCTPHCILSIILDHRSLVTIPTKCQGVKLGRPSSIQFRFVSITLNHLTHLCLSFGHFYCFISPVLPDVRDRSWAHLLERNKNMTVDKLVALVNVSHGETYKTSKVLTTGYNYPPCPGQKIFYV